MFNKGWNNLLPGVTSFQLRVSPWWDQTVIKWIYLSKTPICLSICLCVCLVIDLSGWTAGKPGVSSSCDHEMAASCSYCGVWQELLCVRSFLWCFCLFTLLSRWILLSDKFLFSKKIFLCNCFQCNCFVLYTVCLTSNLAEILKEKWKFVTFHIFKAPALRLTVLLF